MGVATRADAVPVSLNVIVVGAGIAGLASAIALRRAGHRVRVLEQSSLASEVGAAINVGANATRILLPWGLDPVRAGMVKCDGLTRFNADDLSVLFETPPGFFEGFDVPFYLSHRVDLHNELKLLATQVDGPGRPVILQLKRRVAHAYPDTGLVQLDDGTLLTADIIVASDGVHSVFPAIVTGTPTRAQPTGSASFRFLLDTKSMLDDPETRPLVNENPDHCKLFLIDEHRRIISYPCRNNEIQNFAFIHPENDQNQAVESWRVVVDQETLLEQCKNMHPSLLAVCRKAQDVKRWKLVYRSPIRPWYNGRIVLYVCIAGDAAHPMLPHQGQGGAQAIEDGAALGLCLSDLRDKDISTIEARFAAYQQVRAKRASAMQIFSNAGQDQAERIKEDAQKYVDGNIPSNPMEFMTWNFTYDVVKHCEEVLNSVPLANVRNGAVE